jgi:hypothetical protein
VPEEYRLLKINKLSNDDNDDDYQSPKWIKYTLIW